MIAPHTIIAARCHGEVRYAVASEASGSLARLLMKFGLVPDESLLIEHDRNSALEILTTLLWKDMAYADECMPREQAESFAKAILVEHAKPGARYFSNGNFAKGESWNPLTESTFDAGLVITDPTRRQHFCIWFQDED